MLRCLKQILRQSSRINAVFVIDNASTDNTLQHLIDNGFLFREVLASNDGTKSCELNGTVIYYTCLRVNSGGAGGFHYGLKKAYEADQFSTFWMMDDDGYPEESCLENLLPYISTYSYVMPVSIDIERHDRLSWPVRTKEGSKTIFYNELRSSWGEKVDYIFPFNGSLLTKELVEKVGYPKKELFIWGDEYEHYWRCRKAGYRPITITKALFYHPADKMAFIPVFMGRYKVPYTESKWRFVCLVRNSTYIYWNYSGKYKIFLKFIIYSYLFLLKRPSLSLYLLYIKSVIDGVKGDFYRHWKYLN